VMGGDQRLTDILREKGHHYLQLITHNTFVYESSPELLGGVSS
jgi:hypothetical protein